MKLTFTHSTAPAFIKSGHFGSQIAAKQRVGQRNNLLVKQFTVDMPDKVNKDWYDELTRKLDGVKLQSLKHTIRVQDSTNFLQLGYKAVLKEQGMDYLTLRINPMQEGFVTQVGRAIILLKQVAKQKINGIV